MRLTFLGPPGAGKGTQARILANYFKAPHVSTGDLLRDEMRRDTEIGAAVRDIMNSGGLVADDIVLRLINDTLRSGKYVLDGYPRTLQQAEMLDQFNEGLNLPLDRAVYVDVPDDVIVERMSGRHICPGCGAIFHSAHNKPKVADICDMCGGGLITREDDKAHRVAHRLKIYHEVTSPIIGYYREKGILLEVSGIGSMADITNNIIAGLKNGNNN